MLDLQSILLITKNPVEALKQCVDLDLASPTVDDLIIEPHPSIGIEDVRLIHQFCHHTPLKKPKKRIVLRDAHLMTVEAQNALLKILEEPPAFVVVLLIAPDTHAFLSTILSRCHVEYFRQNDGRKTDQIDTSVITSLINQTPAQRLSALPSLKGKQPALEYCQPLIDAAEVLFYTAPSPSTAHMVKVLTQCYERINRNANPTIALTDALLSI